MDTSRFLAVPNKKVVLSKIDTSFSGDYNSKKDAEKKLEENVLKMRELQAKLYAHDRYAMLIIFQAMDAAGKDGAIKHVMSGLNPQGCMVFSFKQPSQKELDHDYLWRIHRSAPERGRIGIFNRSHYEEVLVVRVHDLIKKQKLPFSTINNNIWKQRYRQISDFEKHLYENGTIILKFFLHISKDEQKKRFLSRIDNPSKNWKFSEADLKERNHWDAYQQYYEETISGTSKKNAPWYIIPGDKKWFARLAISEIIVKTMEKMKIKYPQLKEEQLKLLQGYKEKLLNEQ